MDNEIFLIKLYEILLSSFGKQNWWPGETRDEIIIGAVLTQNTNWKNVEKAISNLKTNNCLSLECLRNASSDTIASLIRPAGFYKQKTSTLKEIAYYFTNNFNRNIKKKPYKFREELLSLKGIGNETGDSILLYAFDIPFFVVDAYTKRILIRHKIIGNHDSYLEIQSLFHSFIPKNAYVYNEYHALMVKLGKEYCLKKEPKCNTCPIKKGGL